MVEHGCCAGSRFTIPLQWHTRGVGAGGFRAEVGAHCKWTSPEFLTRIDRENGTASIVGVGENPFTIDHHAIDRFSAAVEEVGVDSSYNLLIVGVLSICDGARRFKSRNTLS